MPPAQEITFSGSVPARFRDEVERLFFFNGQQGRLLPQIRAIIAKTGAPSIIEGDEKVWIAVASGATQCLFACGPDKRPLGVALYGRPAPDIISIFHMAVASGRNGETSEIAKLMVGTIKEIARSIRGVTRVELPYHPERFLRVGDASNAPR